ncbi:MAG: hypothetical protein ACYTDX_03200 [Planctomycetota bacterium]|jgi:hypothetical protein
MRLFRAYGLTLAADGDMPELEVVDSGEPDLVFSVADHAPEPVTTDDAWIPLSFSDVEDPWSEMRRRGEDYVVRVGGLVEFEVSSATDRVVARPLEPVEDVTLRHLLIDHVLPSVVAHRGGIVLHGSAVAGPGGVLAFVGDSGVGKSTLASALCDRGMPLLADDALWIRTAGGVATVEASYPGLRIWPGSCQDRGRSADAPAMADYSEKVRLSGGDLPGGSLPRDEGIRRIHLVEPPGERVEILIEPVPFGKAVSGLLRHGSVLDPEDRERMRRQFETVTDSSVVHSVRRLSFPRDESRIEELVDRILEEAEAP